MRAFSRCVFALVILLSLHATALAEGDSRQAQVTAANADALATLRKEVLATPLLGDVTVQSFLDKAGGQEQIDSVLRSAEQIGAPRWLDEHTCQVRLELHGRDLGKSLIQIAQTKPRALPVSLETFRSRLRSWDRRTFSATGTSTGGSAVDRLRPDPSQVPWRVVSDKSRRTAIDSARNNAVDHVMESLEPVEWGKGERLAQAFKITAVNDSLRGWLSDRPITAIEFRDDLEVRLTLAAPAEELFPVLKTSLSRQSKIPPPASPVQWDQVRKQVVSRMAPPVGSAVAESGKAAEGAVALPAQPPDWVEATVDEEGLATNQTSKLRAARFAEQVAREHLRTRLDALPLGKGQTLGQAAKGDPRIDQAVDRSLGKAHVYKIEYDTPMPGSVHVLMQIDLEEVWRELNAR